MIIGLPKEKETPRWLKRWGDCEERWGGGLVGVDSRQRAETLGLRIFLSVATVRVWPVVKAGTSGISRHDSAE